MPDSLVLEPTHEIDNDLDRGLTLRECPNFG